MLVVGEVESVPLGSVVGSSTAVRMVAAAWSSFNRPFRYLVISFLRYFLRYANSTYSGRARRMLGSREQDCVVGQDFVGSMCWELGFPVVAYLSFCLE